MAHRIDEDHKDFHDVYAGRRRKALRKFTNNGHILKKRGKNGKVVITIPRIDRPFIVHGENPEGLGRGPGKPGDVIGQDDPKGKGNGPGDGEGEGIEVAVDIEEVFKIMEEELGLPELKPKPNEVFEEIEIKYNDISLVGPESLRHNRRTLLQALKRQCADGSINELHKVPGFVDPIRLITPINSDKRYRQYKEIRKPSSNAIIFFARDGSGSMDSERCDIANDIAWWIDMWVRRYYKRVERCYIWHDTAAQEVDEAKFYKYRSGGGTRCSSALKLIAEQFENRFPPNKWNIYVIYFTDGDNWGEDNETFCKIIEEQFGPEVVNLMGVIQIKPWDTQSNIKKMVDARFVNAKNIKTSEVSNSGDRYEEEKKVIIDILGKTKNRY